jgi:diguanylate cyclase (GGDEF)-like protein
MPTLGSIAAKGLSVFTALRRASAAPVIPGAPSSKIPWSKSLLVRLVMLVVLTILPVKAFEIVNLAALHGSEVQEVKQQTRDAVNIAAAEQGQAIDGSREFMRAIASLESVRRRDRDACNAALALLAPHYPNYEFFGVVDRAGVRFCSSAVPFPGAVSLADHSFFSLARRQQGLTVGEFRVGALKQHPVLELGYPYFDEGGALAGVVYAGLSLHYSTALLAKRPIAPSGELIIADSTGVVLGSAPDASWVGKTLPEGHLGVLHARSNGLTDMPGLDGKPRMFAYVPADSALSGGLYVAFGVERGVALAKVNATTYRSGGLIVGGVLIAILVTRIIGYVFVRRPFAALLAAVRAWENGDWTARVSIGRDAGECTVMAHAFNEMAETVSRELAERKSAEALLAQSNAELVDRGHALGRQTARIATLATMSQRLQGCASEKEFAECVTCFAPLILPGVPGALYLFSDAKSHLHVVATWHDPAGAIPEFASDDCWGLRRGQVHSVADAHDDVACAHVNGRSVAGSSCRPLIAHGEAIGLVYLEWRGASAGAAIDEATNNDLDVFTESLALALANHRLRESLRDQSIRDPLTGLYNRRYLQEVLELDFARASRTGESFSLIMADLDHFKGFNDHFGHDAGDHILTRFANVLASQIRKGDMACRFGGEEFLVLIRGAGAADAAARADQICAGTRALQAQFHGKSLGPVTVSIGVASAPEHASDPESLFAAADAALYAAKRAGRDRVAIALDTAADGHAAALTSHREAA